MNIVNASNAQHSAGLGSWFTDIRNVVEDKITGSLSTPSNTVLTPQTGSQPPMTSVASTTVMGVSVPVLAAAAILGLLTLKMLKRK